MSPRFLSSDELQAVYGTLRDDDDSGAAWTREFLSGVESARDGEVDGAAMYWSSEGLWPFAVLHPASPALASTHELAEELAAAYAAAAAAGAVSASAGAAASASSSGRVAPVDASSLVDLRSRIRVRLLSWGPAGCPTFAEKLAQADGIEGYDPENEAGSEYVRRRVWARLLPPKEAPSAPRASCAAAASGASLFTAQEADARSQAQAHPRRVAAWLYVKQAGMREVGGTNERMEHGDWMQRDRSRKLPVLP